MSHAYGDEEPMLPIGGRGVVKSNSENDLATLNGGNGMRLSTDLILTLARLLSTGVGKLCLPLNFGHLFLAYLPQSLFVQTLVPSDGAAATR